jgi:hypothetical protein
MNYDNQRPTHLKDGILRQYITEDNRIIIEQLKNGEWVNVIDAPYTEDDNGTIGLNGRWY